MIERHGDLVEALLVERERAARPTPFRSRLLAEMLSVFYGFIPSVSPPVGHRTTRLSATMEKRSSPERRPQDTYPTPAAALEPLLLYLRPETHFIEPCAGDGCLVGHLKRAGHVLVGVLRSSGITRG